MTVQAPTLRQVGLYGDAVTARLPARFQDVSDFRPVPDHQEVWADGATDQSVVIEVAEYSNVPDVEVGKFIFEDMANANEAISSSITDIRQLGNTEVPNMPAGTYMCLVTGQQEASKGRDGADRANSVHMLVAIIRLPQHGSDLLITVNAPTFISPSSSAAQQAQQGARPAAQTEAAAVMQALLQSLKVEDWGLFGG